MSGPVPSMRAWIDSSAARGMLSWIPGPRHLSQRALSGRESLLEGADPPPERKDLRSCGPQLPHGHAIVSEDPDQGCASAFARFRVDLCRETKETRNAERPEVAGRPRARPGCRRSRRDELVERQSYDHRGGTLKLLAKAAGGTLDPQVNYTLEYWQLYQATYDGLLAFKKAGGNAAFDVVPDLASGYKISNGGKTWDVHAPQGDQVLERAAGDGEGRRRVVPADLQGEEPDRRRLLLRHRRSDEVPEDAGHVHARGRRVGERREEHRDDQPDGARSRVQVQARGPARERSSRRTRRRTMPARSRCRHRARTTSRRTTRRSSS